MDMQNFGVQPRCIMVYVKMVNKALISYNKVYSAAFFS